MKLQQKFGHDQRFKMDERFLESDDEMELTSNTPDFQEDDLSNQLKEEKLLSLKVLNDVLGSNSVFFEEDEDARNIYRYRKSGILLLNKSNYFLIPFDSR